MQTLTVSVLDTLNGQAGEVYKSLAGPPEFLAFGDAPTGEKAAQFATILDLPDAGQRPEPTRWRFVVGIDLEAGHEAEFEEWYNVEHLPALAQVPGVRRAVRFRRTDQDAGNADDLPAYLALYDIDAPEIAGNPDWQAAVNTPWTETMRPHFTARWRGCYERVSE